MIMVLFDLFQIELVSLIEEPTKTELVHRGTTMIIIRLKMDNQENTAKITANLIRAQSGGYINCFMVEIKYHLFLWVYIYM